MPRRAAFPQVERPIEPATSSSRRTRWVVGLAIAAVLIVETLVIVMVQPWPGPSRESGMTATLVVAGGPPGAVFDATVTLVVATPNPETVITTRTVTASAGGTIVSVPLQPGLYQVELWMGDPNAPGNTPCESQSVQVPDGKLLPLTLSCEVP